MIIDRIRVATRLFREKIGPCSAIVAAGGVAANDALRRAMGALLRGGRRHAGHPAAEAVHGQRRDDPPGPASSGWA